MLRGLCLRSWLRQGSCVAALLLTITLSSCIGKTKSGSSSVNSVSSQPQTVSAQTSSTAAHTARRIVLPNPALMGCKSAKCTQMLPDQIAYPDAIHPWQVSVDFTGGEVIGLTTLYDQPATMDDLQAEVDQRYGKWAVAQFRTGPVRLWRVEPEKFVINLTVTDGGMVQVIYLTFDAKHPLSDPARKKFLERLDATHPDPFARKLVVESLTPQSR
jgi:hypothetical protein